jgi:hypothetical protein
MTAGGPPNSLERAAKEARRVIHDNDVDRLKQLLAEHPALLSWRGDAAESGGGLLGFATGSFGDSFDPISEQAFTRAACAELLIDAGAVVLPPVHRGLLESRARGLLELFRRKGVLPRTLAFQAALGDRDAVQTALADGGRDPALVNEAFTCACRFRHEDVAALLLDRAIALDPQLGGRIDGGVGRRAFIAHFLEYRFPDFARAIALGPWTTFVLDQISRALKDHDLTAFVGGLQRDPWLLGDAFVWFQVDLIETATLNDRQDFIVALLDLEPALLRQQPPPPAQAIEFAVTYAHTHLIPLLSRVWPLPDDLPHAAATGRLDRVRRWFDDSGALALGDPNAHYPYNDARARGHLQWDPPTPQQVLDTAFAFAVVNRHFDVADFLLQRGADINTTWSSHEPASILHELVFQGNYDSMRFLIDRGIDMTTQDYRWKATAQGWARYAAHDEDMARWLAAAEQQRKPGR